MSHYAFDGGELAARDGSWFVYVLYLYDCSGFKVGFSCNPLQRMYGFNRRYFERFDLEQSLLLQLHSCDDARDAEAGIKRALAQFRTDCPSWVAVDAGGHTEWFSAVSYHEAVAHLRRRSASHPARVMVAADYIRAELRRLSSSFELWAWRQAQQVCEAGAHPTGLRVQIETAKSLRDWLDAYRHLDIELFAEDQEVARFVARCALS